MGFMGLLKGFNGLKHLSQCLGGKKCLIIIVVAAVSQGVTQCQTHNEYTVHMRSLLSGLILY